MELLEKVFTKLEIAVSSVSDDEKAECIELVSQAVDIVYSANIIVPRGVFVFAEKDKPFNHFKHTVMSGSAHEDSDKTNALVSATLFPAYAAEDDIGNLYEQVVVDIYFPPSNAAVVSQQKQINQTSSDETTTILSQTNNTPNYTTPDRHSLTIPRADSPTLPSPARPISCCLVQ